MAFHLNQAPGAEIDVKTMREARNGGVVAHARGARVGRLQRIPDVIVVERVIIFSHGDNHAVIRSHERRWVTGPG